MEGNWLQHTFCRKCKILYFLGAIIDIVDGSGSTMLHIAAQNGHDLLVERLLQKGARPDLQNSAGMTALHLAARGGYAECVKKLLATDMDLDIRDNNDRTPLHHAAYKG